MIDTQLNLDHIVSLDQLNMGPIIAQSGGAFSPERRKNKLIEELASGSMIIPHYVSNILTGYVQFINRQPDEIYFLSLQIHPDWQNGIVLRKLLRRVVHELLELDFRVVNSSVHVDNKRSISFHKRLGLKEISRSEGRVKFEAPKSSLKNLLKNKTAQLRNQ